MHNGFIIVTQGYATSLFAWQGYINLLQRQETGGSVEIIDGIMYCLKQKTFHGLFSLICQEGH